MNIKNFAAGNFCLVVLIAILIGPCLNAQAAERGQWQTSNLNGLSYRVLLPQDFNPGKIYPVVLFLHGAGQDLQDSDLIPKTADAFLNTPSFRSKYPAIVVAPQCKGSVDFKSCNWGGIDADSGSQQTNAIAIVQRIKSQYRVDEHRVYVTGFSLGGIGSWDIIVRYNSLFAAALPIAGGSYHGANCQEANLLDTPVWAVHGAEDNIVPPTNDRLMYDCMLKLGAKLLHYTEYQGIGHDAWTTAYGDDTYFDWLFSQSR